MDSNEKSFWKYVLGRVVKYVLINLAAVLFMFLLPVFLPIQVNSSDFLSLEYTICLLIANCTGILFGKLHKVQKLLEEQNEILSEKT